MAAPPEQICSKTSTVLQAQFVTGCQNVAIGVVGIGPHDQTHNYWHGLYLGGGGGKDMPWCHVLHWVLNSHD